MRNDTLKEDGEDCGHPILDTIGKMAVRIRELERQRDNAEETLTRVETERLELIEENNELDLRLDECLKLLNRVRRELPKSQYPDLVEAVNRLIEG